MHESRNPRRRACARKAISRLGFAEPLEPRLLLAKTVFVDVDATDATHDGTTWATAFTDLQQGLAAAEAGDSIHVANGTYTPSADDPAISFQLLSDVSVLGGFAGAGAADPDARDIAAFETILSGTLNGAASKHVVNASGVDGGALLDGVTISGGFNSDSGEEGGGGAGLLCIEGAPTIQNCTFSNNDSIANGGAVLAESSTITFINCVFHDNGTMMSGGAIATQLVTSLKVTGCTFNVNIAETSGGAILVVDTSSAIIEGSSFTQGNAFAGGAIANDSDGINIAGCTFTKNTGNAAGGAIANFGAGSGSIIDCTFTANESAMGGAVANTSSFVDYINCAFVNNIAMPAPGAGVGGAMYNESALPNIINCTFSGNRAGEKGGAMHSLSSAPNIANSILWGDFAPVGPELSDSADGSLIFNIIQGGASGGTGNIDADPFFTINPNPDTQTTGDLRLNAGSPALDAGLNSELPDDIETDLAGNSRFEDTAGANDPGAIVDMGAFERPGGEIRGIAFSDLDGDGAIDAGESGLAGRTVFIDFDNDGVIDGGDIAAGTDGSGAYFFSGLFAGTYIVRQVLPDGWSQTFPLDGAGISITLAPGGELAASENFGSRLPPTQGSISGFVYNDLNGNRAKDANEAGIADRTVYIDLDNDVVLDANEVSTTTDPAGQYTFAGLNAGTFKVRQVVPTGWSQTFPLNNFGLNVTLVAGQNATERNFFVRQNPVVTQGSISGFVYNDLNGNRAKDANETGIAGRTVYIDLDNDVVLDANEKSTTTDGAGQYTLTNLPAGTYKVREVVPAGWAQTFPLNNFGLNVTLAAGQNSTGRNFFVRQNAGAITSISGFVYNDLDGDGAKDPGEAGIAGRTVFIDLDNDSALDANEKSAITDAAGQYVLSNLLGGTYKVRQVRPAGWSQTFPLNNFGLNVTVSVGQTVAGRNFFIRPTPGGTGSIAGLVFHDLDRDGVKDSAESGLSAWTVYLDLDNDSTLDTNEQRVLTDASGNYIFSNLGAGTYKIRLVKAAGFVQTTPANNFGNNATLTTSGSAVGGKNFGADN